MKMPYKLILGACLACLFFPGCGSHSSATILNVPSDGLPYTKSIAAMQKGDAYRLRMPDGQELAFWCDAQDFPLAEQTTNSGLDLSWGEKPFKHSPVVYDRHNDKEKSTTHIIFEGVATNSKTSESSFIVGKWFITLAEDIQSSNGLPVTVTVTSGTGTEN